MPMLNAEIADRFDEVADILDVQGANPFRVRAYRNAARVLRAYGIEMSDLIARGGKLDKVPAIGHDLALRIAELVKTGKSTELDKIRKQVPPIAIELLTIPAIGPKRAKILCDELHIKSLEQLHRAALDHRISALKGFGAKAEQAILAAVVQKRSRPQRMKLALAAPLADAIVAYMAKAPGIGRLVVAGSFRRGMETVGDLDILATAANQRSIIAYFIAFGDVREMVAAGATRATVILRSGLQVDLRVVAEKSYGSALYYFTGSKAHNIAIRRIAQQKGLKISEYGVFRGQKQIAGATEASVLAAVGLPFIPPELREDRGEIEAAREGKLPTLIELRDLKGDLHVHSAYADGKNTIAEMAAAAKAAGLSYIAMTDHSPRLKRLHGIDPGIIRKQWNEIDKVNAAGSGAHILKGIEVEILEDGSLDLSDEVLLELDLVIAAIHSNFNLSRTRQTERILRAMDHPCFTILAHPTGRLIARREPYDIDLARIIKAAAERGAVLELNADPERLDLSDVACQQAKAEGVRFSIGSDSHSIEGFANLKFGVLQARRGWLEKADVINTLPLGELHQWLKKTKKGLPSSAPPGKRATVKA